MHPGNPTGGGGAKIDCHTQALSPQVSQGWGQNLLSGWGRKRLSQPTRQMVDPLADCMRVLNYRSHHGPPKNPAAALDHRVHDLLPPRVLHYNRYRFFLLLSPAVPFLGHLFSLRFASLSANKSREQVTATFLSQHRMGSAGPKFPQHVLRPMPYVRVTALSRPL